MLKRIITLITALMLVCALPMTAAAAPDIDRYTDEVGLLDQEEYETVLGILDNYSEELKFDIGICVVNGYDKDFDNIEEFSDAVYEQCHFGYGDNRDGILLVLDMKDRDYHFTTTGIGYERFGDDTLEDIFDYYMADELGDGEYFDAFVNYANACKEVMLYDPANGEGVVYVEKELTPEELAELARRNTFGYKFAQFIKRIMIAIIPSGLISLGYVGGVKKQLKSVGVQKAAGRYMTNSRITDKKDLFLYTNTVATPKPRNTSSGTRSGGGGGGIRVGGGGGSTHVSSGGVTHGGRSGKF